MPWVTGDRFGRRRCISVPARHCTPSKAVGAAAPRSDAGLLSTSLRESSRLRAPSARVGASGFTAWPGTPGTAAAGGALVGSASVASRFSLFGSPTTATGRAAAKPVGLGAGADQEPGGRDAEQATLIAQLRV